MVYFRYACFLDKRVVLIKFNILKMLLGLETLFFYGKATLVIFSKGLELI